MSNKLLSIEPELSEGEKFIEEYFLDENIQYEAQKKIYLKGDSKSYRVADFYLPKYDVFVEFFGKWNESADERARYREKKDVYFRNRIPCVFLYPENLGIIEHVFPLRIRKVLSQHGKRKELMRYLSHEFHHQNIGILMVFGFFTLSLVILLLRKQSFEDYLIGIWIQAVLLLGWYYIYSYRHYTRSKKKQ